MGETTRRLVGNLGFPNDFHVAEAIVVRVEAQLRAVIRVKVVQVASLLVL
jgi:hypothetical protein